MVVMVARTVMRPRRARGLASRRPSPNVLAARRYPMPWTSSRPPAEAGHDRPSVRIDEPDLARRETDARHAGARGEAEALRLGAGVADHDRRRPAAAVARTAPRPNPAVDAAAGDAEVDDALAGAVEAWSRGRRRACVDLAGRAGERAVEEVEDRRRRGRAARRRARPVGRRERRRRRDAEKPMTVSAFGRQAEAAEDAARSGSARPRTRARKRRRDERAAHEAALRARLLAP